MKKSNLCRFVILFLLSLNYLVACQEENLSSESTNQKNFNNIVESNQEANTNNFALKDARCPPPFVPVLVRGVGKSYGGINSFDGSYFECRLPSPCSNSSGEEGFKCGGTCCEKGKVCRLDNGYGCVDPGHFCEGQVLNYCVQRSNKNGVREEKVECCQHPKVCKNLGDGFVGCMDQKECPNGQVWLGASKGCRCSDGSVPQGIYNKNPCPTTTPVVPQCPANSTWNGQNCVCNTGFTTYDGKTCVRPVSPTSVPPTLTPNPTTTQIPSPTTVPGGTCGGRPDPAPGYNECCDLGNGNLIWVTKGQCSKYGTTILIPTNNTNP